MALCKLNAISEELRVGIQSGATCGNQGWKAVRNQGYKL
jgi:hypothetical protein